MTIIKIDAKIDWKCLRAKGGNWVGICAPLALTVQSETWATLMEDIGQTLNAMLGDLMRSNELDKFLRERGWRTMQPIPQRPDDVWFDIPFFREV